jgi:hypothetical protein
MEPKLDDENPFDHIFGEYLSAGFDKKIKFPKPSEEFLERVEGELAVYAQPGGRFRYSVVAGTRIYEVILPSKLGLAYTDLEGKTQIALFPNVKSIDFPVDAEITDRISITYKSNNETKYYHIGIGGFKGIYFED